ncbi:phage terminase small subunit-related protein [Domibacillus iocasae]|nr:phage terminase small subunit-related protein [Domibacillus iocasae]
MAEPRNPKRDEGFQLWLNNIEIAAELDVSDSQTSPVSKKLPSLAAYSSE